MTPPKKVHCFFEQSGTFKNEFIKLGIPAEDYDIQNNFGQTDHQDDLFAAIEAAYDNKPSLFDSIRGGADGDLIMAFFPCINFCDAKVMQFRGVSIFQKGWSVQQIMRNNVPLAYERNEFYVRLLKLVAITQERGIRLIIENPWNTSQMTYLQTNFIQPSIIDRNRARRGDYYVKPTAYWFFGAEPTHGYTEQINAHPKIVYKEHGEKQVTGQCDEMRSLISPDYARNFICISFSASRKHSLNSIYLKTHNMNKDTLDKANNLQYLIDDTTVFINGINKITKVSRVEFYDDNTGNHVSIECCTSPAIQQFSNHLLELSLRMLEDERDAAIKEFEKL